MEKLRVLHMIGGLNVGGSQSVVLNLYKNVDREKIQFDFIIDEPNQIRYKEMVEEMGAKVFVLPKLKGFNVFKVKKAWRKFFREHPEYKILHSHVRSYASIYISIAKKFGVKTIIHSHNTSNGKGITAIIKKILQRPLRRKADYLFACSTEAGKWLYGEKACKKDNYIFLPNAIDLSTYAFNEDVRRDYRAKLGVEDKFVIGHAGNFREPKNHLFLLEVFSEVLKVRKNAVLLLAGDGPLRAQIESKIEELKISSSVIMLGARDDVNKLYCAMDVFAFPSLWEGLPVVIVEAQVSGLTCLMSDKVTKDVDLTSLVKRLSIEDKKAWVDSLVNFNAERLNVVSEIEKCGFDIKYTANKITNFYFEILK